MNLMKYVVEDREKKRRHPVEQSVQWKWSSVEERERLENILQANCCTLRVKEKT